MKADYEKARRWLREYLNSQSNMSPVSNRRLFKLIENEFAECMAQPGYSTVIYKFIGERQVKASKDAFFFIVVRGIIINTDLRHKLKELYPNDYSW